MRSPARRGTKRTVQHFRSKDQLVGAALAAATRPPWPALRADVQGHRRVGPRRGLWPMWMVSHSASAAVPLICRLEMREPITGTRGVRSHTDARRALAPSSSGPKVVADETTSMRSCCSSRGTVALSAAVTTRRWRSAQRSGQAPHERWSQPGISQFRLSRPVCILKIADVEMQRPRSGPKCALIRSRRAYYPGAEARNYLQVTDWSSMSKGSRASPERHVLVNEGRRCWAPEAKLDARGH